MSETGAGTRLTVDDAFAIKKQISNVRDASPTVTGRGQATFENKNWNTRITGVESSYARMRASIPIVGRFFTDEENGKRSRVAVIGTTILRELFQDQNPIGQSIKINKVNFQVIGILPQKGASGFMDRDDIIVIPIYTAMRRLLGKDYVDTIEIEAISATEIEKTQDDIIDIISKRHRIPLSQKENSFNIRNMADIQDALSSSTKIMTILLSIIAAISLIVGGIGIMNIMLVSVTERTREIGLRKAIGAKRKDILSQFLSESITVSTLGGCFGIMLAWISTMILSHFAGWATTITTSSVILAFGFSALTGIVFGVYPAVKASKLNPIDALRYE
jgi:macrolide transport system ATP-binding/permease protein